MRFIKFPVSSTNIFPLANSTAGGQLLSEWNLRSRETVGTNANVKYEIGPSYTHSKDDFKISANLDNIGQPINSTEIAISEGKAIVNGHFIQSLAPVYIDLAEANAELELHDRSPLRGKLAIGLKAIYSTEQTMAGAMVPEKRSDANSETEEIDDTATSMYYGIQVVILPVDEMKTPDDERIEPNNVTCDLLLGTFDYSQGAVQNVTPNDDRIRYIEGERITNINEILSTEYVSKYGLMPDRLYVMSGKSRLESDDTNPWRDTWCDATNSLVNWTGQMTIVEDKPVLKASQFLVDDDSTVSLHLSHKQVDGMTKLKTVDDQNVNVPAYYQDTVLPIPAASYGANTPGIVTREYTENLKLLASKLANVFQFSKGKQIAYKESLMSKEELPRINSAWDVGDYVLVKQDYTLEIGNDLASYPSTMYAVIPGYIADVSYYGEVTDSDEIPSGLTGVELQSINIDDIPVKKTSIAGEALGKDTNYFSNVPIGSEMAQLILSGAQVYTFKVDDLFVDSSENASETDSIEINTGEYSVSADLTELYSSNSEFANHYSDYSDQSITFTEHSVTIHKVADTWADCGIAVGDTLIVIYNKNASIESQGMSSSVMELQSMVDFNPITGEITNDIAKKAIDYCLAKGVYTYYKLIQPDLFSDYATFRGEPYKDYFVAIRTWKDPDDENISHTTRYYFVITQSMPREWSDAITITGSMYLAQENSIGGFYDVASDKTDAGYVYLDSDGHLKLRDYALLRSGTLAYQLGEDVEEFGSGEDISTIQETLDEYINDRIAFPTEKQQKNSDTPTVIHVTINLTDATPSGDTDTGTRNLFIRNIDSRFGTSVHFHFNGDATHKTIINFVGCEKIRIDSNICGSTMGSSYANGPIINVYRCGLYYDPAVLNYISTCERPYDTDFSVYDYENDVFYTDNYPSWFTGMQDIKLWYQAYSDTDPRLTVDDMTVSDLDVAMVAEDIDYWTPLAPNDNHFSAALSSLTFDSSGTIVRCGLLVADTSTTNIQAVGEYLVLGKFTLPQGSGLIYPKGCLTRQLKISGSFTTAYLSDPSHNVWNICDTNFTAITEKYNRYTGSTTETELGSIAFHEKVSVLEVNLGSDVNEITPFKPDKYHLFTGGLCW